MAASSENLAASIDPFLLRHSFSDYFLPTLAEDDLNLILQPHEPDHHHHHHHHYQNQSFSSSDLEQQIQKPTPTAPKRLATKPRITKRKSRATKKNQTTFITADPANFRHMVQQVTGIRFDTNSSSPPLKPETRRPVGRFYNACLPTLDTSSFLLDQSQSMIADRSVFVGGVASQSASGGGGGGYGASDGFASFPTLESWKVM